jgi:filamentous hemagglutinin family protein
MRSPIFFSKKRVVRFWIQILLVLALVRIAVVPSALYGNPLGEQVVGGAAGFSRPDAATLIVNQHTDRAVINWNSFSIANGELTKFVQPNSTSSVLNRVVTANPSQIYGTLQANGNVFLINPGGVLVGAGGSVNTASFMGTTHDISTDEFMRGGQMNFTGSSDASVINQGKIEATSGDVFLVAKEVKNEGQIMAKDGTVGLVSGTAVTLETVGSGRSYKVRLMAAEKPMTENGGQKTEGSGEIVNEGVIEAANVELQATGNYLSLAIKNTGTIRATGLVENADGSVTLTGGEGDVLNTGVVAALQKSVNGVEQGGAIDISGKNIRAEEGSLITASGQESGGKIKIQSKDTTMLAGRVEATGYSAKSKGGRVEALGSQVGLRAGEINVDGGAKGGTVLVGGDYLGSNRDVPNAKAVVMLPDAKISANARENGDGGKVILWSDEYTGFFGKIAALGGAEGGNGGFIETSSKNNLQAFGEAQASAPKGLAGEWLLDPYDVTIGSQGPSTGGGFNGQNPDIFTPTSNDAKIFNGDINRALDAGTSVTITTGPAVTVPTPPGAGEPAGNITVAADITKTKDTPTDSPSVVLRLQAANNIVVNGGVTISSTSGNLGIELLADYDNSGSGFVDLRDNVTLASNSGNIILQSGPGLTVGADVSINATLSLATSNAIWGGQRFSGNVTFRTSAPATATTVGVGGGAGALQITQGIVDSVVLLDSTAATTARAGTVNIGSRSSGLLTLGTLTSPNGLNYNVSLVSGTGGIAQTAGGSGLDVGQATAIVDTAGRIGTALDPLRFSTQRLGIFTGGVSFDIISSQILNRLHVETAGTTTSQNLFDNNAASFANSNLKYDVAEGGGNTTIGGDSGKATGFTVSTGSIDFSYVNTSTLSGAGNVTIGTAGTMANPAGSGVTFSGTKLGIPFGIMAVQDPNGASGPWLGTPGKVSLSMNGTLYLDSVGVSYTSAYDATGLGSATTTVASGGIFSGGGDISVQAKDIDFQNTQGSTVLTAPSYNNASDFFVVWGPQWGAALNAFSPALNNTTAAITMGTSFYDFGTRAGDAYNPKEGEGTFGQLSGSSGTILIGAVSSATGPTPIIFTDPQTNVVQGQMNISVYETWGMESKAVQIGSADTGDIILGTLPTIDNLTYTYFNGNVTIVVGGVSYVPRYFESPFAALIDGVFSPPWNPQEGYSPPPHVEDIKVSLVSGTGRVEMGVRSDVNVSGFSVTAISGIDLQGNERNDNYAPTDENASTFTAKDGSQFDFFSGRVGRTYLDSQSSSGGTFAAHFSQDGMIISDSTEVITGRAVMEGAVYGTSAAAAGSLGVVGVQLDPQYTSPSGAEFFNFAAAYPANMQVIIGAPDLAEVAPGVPSVQATGVFALNSAGSPTVNITNPGSGYLKPPAVLVVAPKNADSETLAGFQQAGALAQINGSGSVTQITPVLDAGAGLTLGGSGYQSAPDISFVGGGIELGSARAVTDEYGRIGVVAPISAGLGYTSAPDVSITGGGGAGAEVLAIINERGQLTPYNVDFGGSGFRSTPTIVIEDPTGQGCGAIARPIMSGITDGVLLGIMPVVGGSGYVPGTTLTVRILGGDPGVEARASVVVPEGTDSLTSFVIKNPGSGYANEPTITLSGGGIRPAQARAVVDQNPLSGNYGKVVAYALADPGLGYKTTPTVVVGAGGPSGQFGEVGVRTDNVDLATGSGSITLRSYRGLNNDLADLVFRPVTVLAPVASGNSGATEASAAVSGGILVEATGQVTANYRGILITGDVSPAAGGTDETAFSGDISVAAQRILATGSILNESYGASIAGGFPVQIGSAPSFGSTGIFTFAGNGAFRTQSKEEGAVYIYAPSPYQLDSLYGKALNPNLSAPAVLKVSNDLTVGGISTRANFENPVRVEVGSPEGLLSLRSTVTTGGDPFVNGGEVTFITPTADQRVYATAPNIEISGGGVVKATGRATVSEGRITAIAPVEQGDGYALQPSVTIEGGGGTGARANAVVDFDPASPTYKKIVAIEIIDPGSGYTSSPTITISAPSGDDATILNNQIVTATVNGVQGVVTAVNLIGDNAAAGRQSVINPALVPDPNGQGLGYFAAPNVLIYDQDGQGRGAVATATVNQYGQIIAINVINGGLGYISPQIQIGSPVDQATATARLNDAGQIDAFTIVNQGGGYTAVPQLLARTASLDPYNLDIDHVGFFSDRFDLSSLGTELVTAAVVGLGPFTNQRPVDLGTLTPGATSFVASDVVRFQADGLVLGTRKYDDPAYGAGIITVSQAVNAQSFLVDTLALAGTRQIRDLGGTTGLQFGNVVIDAGAQVTLTGAGNRIKNFAGVIRDTGLAEGASFTIASRLDSIDQGSAWRVPLPLNINEVLIDAPEFTGQRFYQGIETQDGDINVLANDIELSQINGYLDTTGGGAYSVTTSSVTLAPLSGGGSVPIQIYFSTPPLETGAAGVTSIQMETFGSGYTSRPSVVVSPPSSGATATATPNMVLGAIQISSGGSGYLNVPQVTLGAPELPNGIQAEAEAVVDFFPSSVNFGKVVGFRLTNQGSGYLQSPGVTFTGGGASVQATATTTLTVQSVDVFGGQDYTSTPALAFSGGGTGATQATAIALGGFLNLTISNPARAELELVRASSVRIGGNTSLPIVVGSPDGCDDSLSIYASAGAITLNTDFRYNYGLLPYAPRTLVLASQQGISLGLSQIPPSPQPKPATSSIQVPNLSIIAGGAVNLGQYGLATANAFISTSGGGVSSINVDYSGQGYTQAPTVVLTSADGNGSGATANATINDAGQIIGFTITNAGSGYTSAPLVSLTGPIVTAAASPVMGVGNVAISDGGTGYTSAPTVVFAPPTTPGGITATGTATVRNGRIVSVSITNPGSGYTSQPTATFTGGGGTPVVSTTYLSVVDYTVTNPGTGYTVNPGITFSGGGGSGASASALVNSNGQVSGFTEISGGNFYTGVPNMTLTGTPDAPRNTVEFISGLMTGTGNSFRFSRSTGTLTVADLGSLGGATGITTASGGSVFLTAPVVEVPMMLPQLVQPQDTSPYILNGNGDVVVNPAWNPYYNTPPTINSSGSVYLTSSDAGGGRISIAVVPDFDMNAWNSPQPTGSTVQSVIQALSSNSAVVLSANRIEIGDDGTNIEPGLLTPPLIAGNTTSGRVVLQPLTNEDIVLGALKDPGFNFTGTELGNIQANVLQVGNNSAGSILVDTLISLNTSRLTGAFSLIGNSSIGDSGGSTGISYEGGLRLSSNGQITFTGIGNNFGTVAANSNGNNIVLSSEAFSIGTADTLTGITGSGSRVTLQPNAAGVAINLGLTRPSTDWGFSDAELDLVTASILQIGRNDALASGQITVSSAVTLLQTSVPTLNLRTEEGVADSGASSGLSVNSLAIQAGNLATDSSVSLDGSGNNVSNLSAVLINPTGIADPLVKFFHFTDNNSSSSSPLNITTVDGLSGIDTSAGNGAIILTADDMNIVSLITAGSGGITLQPLTPSTNISLNDPSNSLSLTEAELRLLSTSTTVVIGNASGTGTITLGGSGNINLSDNLSYAYSLTLRGASSSLVFSAPVLPAVTGGLTLANNQTLTLALGTGAVTSPFTGRDVTIGGTFGTISILSAGAVGAQGAPLTTDLAILNGATVYPGGLYLSNVGPLTINGALDVEGDVNIAQEIGDMIISQAITTRGGLALTALTGDMNVTGSLAAGGNVALTAGGGDLSLASSVTAGGGVTGISSGNITINDAVTSGGIVSFSSTLAGTSITLGAGGSITSSLANTLSGTPIIQLTADTLVLGGTLAAVNSSGGIFLQPFSDLPIEVFGVAPPSLLGAFFIGDADFAKMSSTVGSTTSPITIGKANGTAQVLVHGSATAYPTGINRNLTIQSGAQPYSAAVDTFIVDGALTTTGTNLTLDAGGGRFLDSAAINVGTGTLTVFGQSLEFNGAVNGGSVSLRNKGIGNSYLAYAGPPAPEPLDQIVFGSGSITTNIFGYGADVGTLFIGTLNVGNVIFPGGFTVNSQGLNLYGGTAVQMEGNITSAGLPVTINGPGPLLLTGNRTITMGGGDLSILAGIDSSAGNQTLGISLGAGDLVLAGGDSADVIEGLTITRAAGSTITMGNASAPSSGLSLTVNGAATGMNIPGEVILVGTGTVALTGTGGAGLMLGSFVQGTGQTTPLTLTTTGGGIISTTGGIQAGSLTLSSSSSATIGGTVTTTGATTLTTGTTLSTQAINASALNVSSGTSATLSGAVSTSTAAGITVSTPTLTTGSTMSAALGNISLAVNSMNLSGTATSQAGNVVLQPFTSGNDLNLGTQVSASSILKLQAPNGSVTFQTAGAGRIMLTGPINLSSSGTDDYNLVTAGGNVVFSGSSPVLTLPTSGLLSLDLGNGNVISSGGTDYAASQGQLLIVSAGNVTMGTDIPTFGVPGRTSSPASLTLRNVGSLSLVGPIDTGTGNVSIRTLSGNLTLASSIKGGLIQLGAAQNFNNQAGSNPFTNRGGGRTLVYSAGQRFDTPYNFAGLNGFGVAFGQAYGSMPSSGNFLVYSSNADVGLADGWQFGSFFAGNSVSALMPFGLFEDVNRLYQPKARSFNLEYMLYPNRVEPETRTLPAAMLGDLEQKFGRPPTLDEIQAREVAVREAAMVKKGAILERTSFDPAIQEREEEERAEGEKVENSDGGVPQAKVERIEPISDGAKPMARLPLSAPQAGKSATSKQGSTGPILRSGPMRSVAELRPAEPAEVKSMDKIPAQAVKLDAKSVIEQERASAEVGIAPPIAAGR